ncbi:MAG: response regulator transcription factor [Solirubrobacterales bacterium]|nr:response regulator transcription factor [Solirubrobacterales bacterium]MBV9365890.1 response regulator transcription factor [Solirubrobacterales bacterium]MBV9684566.1 response regulator transcription factor [Solirubrobacterales bacterium]MBV9809406.1 response regulator transcription factor [Solirubrobacterales bacterium]
MIRVLVVDDNPVIRRGIAALLDEADDVKVVGEAGDGREAIRVAGESRPDVVLLDVRMPVMDGIEAARPLSEQARVMMLTYTDEQERVLAAIRAGASGYLVHGQFDADDLVARIRELAGGDTVLSPAVIGTVFEALRRTPGSPDEADGPASLTAREREIMNLIAQGLTNGEIAARFVLSEKTVKNHVNRIYSKLGAGNRAQATALWLGTAPRKPG